MLSIVGGKATTCRRMAQDMADLLCAKLGVDAACSTGETPLVSYREYYRRQTATHLRTGVQAR
jgi:glycerol-3-phosphate dehydrogenase